MPKDTIISNIPVAQNFRPEAIEVDHYVMGSDRSLDGVAENLMPDGQWDKWLPLGETQYKNGVEPSSCPAGGTLNCYETIGRFKFGASFQSDLSERYLSILMGMDGHGGWPHAAAEIMRVWAGAIPEVYLPFGEKVTSLQAYFSPRPMSYALFKVGAHWLTKYKPGHDWLYEYNTCPLAEKQRRMIEALKSSPLGVSGYAWSLHGDDLYYKDGPDIHWFIVYGYEKGKYWKVFDTYPDGTGSFAKKLDWNYDFGYSKRYSLNYTDAYKAKIAKFGAVDNVPEEAPKSVIIDYIKYLAGWYIKDIFK